MTFEYSFIPLNSFYNLPVDHLIMNHQNHWKGSNGDDFDSHQFCEYFDFDELNNDDLTIDEFYNQYFDVEKPPAAIQDHKNSEIVTELKTHIGLPQKNENDIYDNASDQMAKGQSNFTGNKIKINSKMNQKDFIQYLSLKLTKDKMSKVSKEALIFLYRHFQQTNQMKSLSRDDKREKKRIIDRLYDYSSLIIECFEEDPQTYLLPVILFINHKQNQKKTTIKRVNYLKQQLLNLFMNKKI